VQAESPRWGMQQAALGNALTQANRWTIAIMYNHCLLSLSHVPVPLFGRHIPRSVPCSGATSFSDVRVFVYYWFSFFISSFVFVVCLFVQCFFFFRFFLPSVYGCVFASVFVIVAVSCKLTFFAARETV